MGHMMDISKQSHHERLQLCTTRSTYRQGKKLTAVKVYTVNDESRHLLIHQVPAISLHEELELLCQRYGSIEFIKKIPNYETEEKFCDVYQVKYNVIQSASFAKKNLDDRFVINIFLWWSPPRLLRSRVGNA